MSEPVKNLPHFLESFDGSSLRIAIVHSRWNKSVIDALINGAKRKLKHYKVKEENIIVQSVPGSFELPLACQRVIAGSHVQAGATAIDLLGAQNIGTPRSGTPVLGSGSSAAPIVNFPNAQKIPFDAVIAIGVLIKGATMHFEYISQSVSQALMHVQLETGVPVIFGVLTALTEEQALERAGIGRPGNKGHNHGEDWGSAAVEMASRVRGWSEGRFLE
ncbi:6,7-dimethyl-8-ribityllumazine synthase [Russula aff. rugulosa BPL654]|nr:6,7-dimethyl-8-ribityllumazine synthase [Russula aff. rugulosa BPL654]